MIVHPAILALLVNPSPAKIPGSYFGMPEQASTIAGGVDWMYDFITWLCIFFFVVIVGAMVIFMIKYRRRAHVADPH